MRYFPSGRGPLKRPNMIVIVLNEMGVASRELLGAAASSLLQQPFILQPAPELPKRPAAGGLLSPINAPMSTDVLDEWPGRLKSVHSEELYPVMDSHSRQQRLSYLGVEVSPAATQGAQSGRFSDRSLGSDHRAKGMIEHSLR